MPKNFGNIVVDISLARRIAVIINGILDIVGYQEIKFIIIVEMTQYIEDRMAEKEIQNIHVSLPQYVHFSV